MFMFKSKIWQGFRHPRLQSLLITTVNYEIMKIQERHSSMDLHSAPKQSNFGASQPRVNPSVDCYMDTGKTRLFQAFWQLVGGCLPLEASTTGVLTVLENEVAAFRSCLRALVGSTSLSQTVSGMPPETIWIHQLWRKHLRDVSVSVCQSAKHQRPSVLQFVDPIHLHDNEHPYSSSRIIPEKHSKLSLSVSITSFNLTL